MKILSELALDEKPLHRIGGKDLCDLLGISSGALTDLKKRGLAIHLAHDVYDLEATVRNYVTHLRSIAAGWGTTDQAAQLTAERARLAKEQADAQALKNARLRDELVEAAEVERTWSDVLRQIRARVLAVPARLRTEIPDTQAPIFHAMDRALRDALTELGHADD